ncbi:MAG TPA: hypothetical protein VGJ86_23870 [Acidimicrobiales bacterium]
MRQEHGEWRWPRNLLGVLGTVGALIVVPVGFVVAAFSVALPMGLDGCESSSDTATPRDLGMLVDPAGAIVARVPSCQGGTASALQLLAPDRTVLWRAESTAESQLTEFVVGVAPPGFVDVVPLGGPLDPSTVYEVQMLWLHNATASSDTTAAAQVDSAVQLLGGARASFAPADLVPDSVLLRSTRVTPEDFDNTACTD